METSKPMSKWDYLLLVVESEIHSSKPQSKMDYLLLAAWIHDPDKIDPPPWVLLLPKTPTRRSCTPSKRSRMKKAMKLDHPYCALGPICPGCSKTCSSKPVIQCAYCPIVYHKDCLNPPLTTLLNGGGRWMCPFHPRFLIDCVASMPALAAREPNSRAFLVGAVKVGENVNMRSDVMTVGTADGCALRLNAAQCRCVSSTHAAIYMDKETREFKLVNYSEYGSAVVVNDVVFESDVAQARSPAAEGEASVAAPIVHTVPLPSENPCQCRPQPPELTHGASVLIPDGCLLKFGCQIFQFCITPVKP